MPFYYPAQIQSGQIVTETPTPDAIPKADGDGKLDDWISDSSDTKKGKILLAGQLGGTATSPDIRGLRTTTGPALLTLGAISDGEYLKRVGSDIVGAGVSAGTTLFTGLTDTPADYTDKGSYIVRVKSSADQLEFVDNTSDFLTQYVLLAGRSGGQTITGGTAAGNNLTLSSTSHATKGSFIFGPASNVGMKITGARVSRGDGGGYLDFGTSGYDLSLVNGAGYYAVDGYSQLYCFTSVSVSGINGLLNSNSSFATTGWQAVSTGATHIPLSIKGASSQSGNLLNIINSSSTVLSYINAAGNFGVRMGATASTAYLHIAAGTATASTAPIKLTAGTNLTTPEDGTFEFDGTNLFFTAGGTRRTISWT
jgi:hypothetical protein